MQPSRCGINTHAPPESCVWPSPPRSAAPSRSTPLLPPPPPPSLGTPAPHCISTKLTAV